MGENLIGKKFGRLTVIELDKAKSYNRPYWICKCECGNTKSIYHYSLTSGATKSCGCLNKEIISQKNSKVNIIEYDKTLNCYRCYFNNCNGYFLFDNEDLDVISHCTWCLDKAKGYVTTVLKGTNNSLFVHRAIMKKYYNLNGFVVDHINHNKLDNRKINLRICSQKENIRNSSPHSNTGYKFISYIVKNNYYRVKINNSINKVERYFRSLYDAIDFRDKWINDNPDEFNYNLTNDHRVIHPFIIIDEEKFNRGK